MASVFGDELVRSLRSLPPHIDVPACDVAARGSFAWDLRDLMLLVGHIDTALQDDVEGGWSPTAQTP